MLDDDALANCRSLSQIMRVIVLRSSSTTEIVSDLGSICVLHAIVMVHGSHA